MIKINSLSKTFFVHEKESGLKGSLKSLFKRNFRKVEALKDINLNVSSGEILGLVGSNGAGKTTLAKIISGIVYPTKGYVEVLGFNPHKRSNQFKKQIALVMGQKASLWWDLPAMDCFNLLKHIYNISNCQDILDELISVLNVANLLNIPIRRLSLGERMKMELIGALIHRPKIIFLDEPTIGLDYNTQKLFRNFIKEYQQKYQPSIILTSHYMNDINDICNRIAILNHGEIIFDGPISALKTKYKEKKVIHFFFNSPVDLDDISLFGDIIHSTPLSVAIAVPKEMMTKTLQEMLTTLPILEIKTEEIDINELVNQVVAENL